MDEVVGKLDAFTLSARKETERFFKEQESRISKELSLQMNSVKAAFEDQKGKQYKYKLQLQQDESDRKILQMKLDFEKRINELEAENRRLRRELQKYEISSIPVSPIPSQRKLKIDPQFPTVQSDQMTGQQFRAVPNESVLGSTSGGIDPSESKDYLSFMKVKKKLHFEKSATNEESHEVHTKDESENEDPIEDFDIDSDVLDVMPEIPELIQEEEPVEEVQNLVESLDAEMPAEDFDFSDSEEPIDGIEESVKLDEQPSDPILGSEEELVVESDKADEQLSDPILGSEEIIVESDKADVENLEPNGPSPAISGEDPFEFDVSDGFSEEEVVLEENEEEEIVPEIPAAETEKVGELENAEQEEEVFVFENDVDVSDLLDGEDEIDFF